MLGADTQCVHPKLTHLVFLEHVNFRCTHCRCRTVTPTLKIKFKLGKKLAKISIQYGFKAVSQEKHNFVRGDSSRPAPCTEGAFIKRDVICLQGTKERHKQGIFKKTGNFKGDNPTTDAYRKKTYIFKCFLRV